MERQGCCPLCKTTVLADSIGTHPDNSIDDDDEEENAGRIAAVQSTTTNTLSTHATGTG
jgi:hypothetical protein